MNKLIEENLFFNLHKQVESNFTYKGTITLLNSMLQYD